MQIRGLRAEDYDALVALWDRAGLSYRPKGRDARERVLREMAGPCSVFLGVEEDGRLVGAVLGTHDGRKGWINRLAVDPDHRRRGVGRALVDAVIERLERRGIEITTCLIESWNRPSMSFFQAIGFSRHDEIVYFSRRRSADT